MKIAAAVLALFSAVSAFAAPAPKKDLGETPDLLVSVKVSSPAGSMFAKTRVQAQSKFNLKRDSKDKEPRQLAFGGVPVMNPNNGLVRMEYDLHARWLKSGEEVELQSAIELALGQEIVVHDADDAVVRILVVAASD